ncbi:MAG: hypothetical protein H8E44_26035 [Planctomycetes bacterium]|nr:hypothetical protein [Planctomycetota bacterium]
MARMCSACRFLDADDKLDRCPTCDGDMTFTVLGPEALFAGGPETVDISKWWRHVRRYEHIGASGKRRFAQIVAGIAFFSVIWRWGTGLAGLSYGDEIFQNLHADPRTAIMYVGSLAIGIYVVAALVAGGIAGASTVRWVCQGLCVGLGLTVVWGILLSTLHPYMFQRFYSDTLVFYFLVAMITTAITVSGAYLGRLMIPPIRLPIS